VTSLEFRDRLARRARRAKAHLTIDMLEPLEAYFRLLSQWNAKINLTALPLDTPTDETFDRLLVEPLAASRQIERVLSQFKAVPNPVWFDLGSGGGSPAIPLKIARPALHLTMIESKERKSAFLREVVRTLGLSKADVLNCRFEEATTQMGREVTADLVTVRAVRTDDELFDSAGVLLKNNGRLLMFRPAHSPMSDPTGFTREHTVQLTDSPPAFLTIFRRVFHVEQSR
jgi:16S rRNA (guanine527-N7)-methyltransferase